jgi:hypothetical protein
MARLLEQLRQRLELADDLATDVRQALAEGDAPRIEAATARMETVTQEFKVLAEEYGRLGLDEGEEREPELTRARRKFRETALRLARSSALAGGLLGRLIALSRGLESLLVSGRDGTYLPSGRVSDSGTKGLRLREWV